MTQMHERYAYGALVFLILLVAERADALARRWRFGVVFTLNLLAARPADAGDRGAAADRGAARRSRAPSRCSRSRLPC